MGTGPSFERPSVELAEEHAQRTNPQHLVDRPMWVAPGDMNPFGVGIVLYFTVLRLLAVLFAGLTLAAAPALLANVGGNGTQGLIGHPTALTLAGVSLGNYGAFYNWTRFSEASNATNATLDALSPPPPPPPPDCNVTDVDVTECIPVKLFWEHGAAVTMGLPGTGRHKKDQLSVMLSYFDLGLLAAFALFALGLG